MDDGYIKVRDLLDFCANQKDHSITPNDIMRMNQVGWISVKDRLPKGECIAYSRKYGEMMMGYIGETDESDTRYCCDSNTEWLGDVTHWMPLPEPPKEG